MTDTGSEAQLKDRSHAEPKSETTLGRRKRDSGGDAGSASSSSSDSTSAADSPETAAKRRRIDPPAGSAAETNGCEEDEDDAEVGDEGDEGDDAADKTPSPPSESALAAWRAFMVVVRDFEPHPFEVPCIDDDLQAERCAALFEEKARAGDVESMLMLAFALKCGFGCKKNKKAMFVWFDKAARAGSAIGMRQLGLCFAAVFTYECCKQDDAAAAAWWEKALAAGDVAVTGRLGDLYAAGKGVQQDVKRANQLWELAIDKYGDFEAMRRLGLNLLSGNRIAQDVKRGEELLRRHVKESGSAESAFDLGVRLEERAESADADEDAKRRCLQEAKQLYRAAADKYHDKATMRMVQLTGTRAAAAAATEEDKAEAREWMVRAAERGHMPFVRAVAEHFRAGTGGFAQNAERAFHFFLKGGILMDPASLAPLAECFRTGFGVGKDPARALLWYRKAVELLPKDAEIRKQVAKLEKLDPAERASRR